jgi:anaerobic selenocysteine-containing dehydrogenase
MTARQVHRVCTLCEATCGITVHVEGERIETIRGDVEDPFSRGFICPKAYGLKGLHEDPDRLRVPMHRTADGWKEVSWQQAFDLAIDGLLRVREQHGPQALGAYVGNPTAHSLQAMLYNQVLLRGLGSTQRYSASSVDQLPKMVSAGLMFGAGLTIPVPDLDRTSYLLVLGGNPAVSNGSLMTAPDAPGRISAIVERGGKVVVIDPRRTETVKLASEHHFIRPGTDAAFLLALVHVMFAENLVKLGRAEGHVHGLDTVRDLALRFTPASVASYCGIESNVIATIARELCAAESAACYGRIGTTCQTFGTLASWAVDLVNVLSGNLDTPGGAMFTKPAANRGSNRGQGVHGGRGLKVSGERTRVKQLPQWFGEAPTATLADEIHTAGPGQIRAMITIAGNPVLSAPGSDRMDTAFASLEFMVAVDFYLNETTRHANVILPPPSPLEREAYDYALYQLAIRDVAKYSTPVFERPAGQPEEWEILLTLGKGLMGMREVDLATADDFVFSQIAAGEIGTDGGRWTGLTVEEATAAVGHRRGAARILDLFLRTGPYGDGFGRDLHGISLATLEAKPHGVDLGALKSQLPDVLRTPDAKIDLAPSVIVADLPRLIDSIGSRASNALVLIGRRHLRSNNSWMHNVATLVKGPERCTLLMSEPDAAARKLKTGDSARLRSAAGVVTATVETTTDMMPGVVSLPHGWGHDRAGTRMSVAEKHAGVNVNIVSDDSAIDPISGNAAFNGVPVTVEALSA